MSITVQEAQAMVIRAAAKGIRMTYSTAKPRKQPKAGDRRTTKKHGEQVRVHVMHNGCLVMGGGHRYYRYEWVSLADPRAARYVKGGA